MNTRTATPTSIILTGETIEWDQVNQEEVTIDPSQADTMRKRGYEIAEAGEVIFAFRPLDPEDGTVTLQPKSSFPGRVASEGGHTNYGYSGYFKGLVFVSGKRKRLVDFWRLFENQEHHFAAQQDKRVVAAAISKKIRTLQATPVIKVKGGYAFFPTLMDD